MEYLESNEGGVWAAQSRTGMDVWLGWLGAVLNLDWNVALLWSPPGSRGDYC